MKLRLAKASQLSWSWGLAWLSLAKLEKILSYQILLFNVHNCYVDVDFHYKSHAKLILRRDDIN